MAPTKPNFGAMEPKQRFSLEGMSNKGLRSNVLQLRKKFGCRTDTELVNSLKMRGGHGDSPQDLKFAIDALTESPRAYSRAVVRKLKTEEKIELSNPLDYQNVADDDEFQYISSQKIKMEKPMEHGKRVAGLIADSSDAECKTTPVLTANEKVERVETVMQMHPRLTKYEVHHQLRSCDWDVNRAADKLFDNDSPSCSQFSVLYTPGPSPSDELANSNASSSSEPANEENESSKISGLPDNHYGLPIRHKDGVIPRILISTRKQADFVQKPNFLGKPSTSTNIDDGDIKMEDVDSEETYPDDDDEPRNSQFPGQDLQGESRESSQSDEEEKKKVDAMVQDLMAMYPGAGENRIRIIVQISENDMADAGNMLQDELENGEFGDGPFVEESEDDNQTSGRLEMDIDDENLLRNEEHVKRVARSVERDIPSTKQCKDRRIKQSTSNEQNTGVENASKSKRRADASRAVGRVGDISPSHSGSTNFGLEPTTDWVRELGGDNHGYKVQLRTGVHPQRFSKRVLQRFAKLKDEDFTNEIDNGVPIPLEIMSVEVFDVAVQFIHCRNFQTGMSPTPSKITLLLELAIACEHYAVDTRIFRKILNDMRETLTRDREAIHPNHVDLIYQIKKNDSIRRLFLDAIFMEHMEYRQPNQNDSENEDDDEEFLDLARRTAYGYDTWRFHWQVKNNAQFELDLLRNFHKAWKHRLVDMVKLSKNQRKRYKRTSLIDPFNQTPIEVSSALHSED